MDRRRAQGPEISRVRSKTYAAVRHVLREPPARGGVLLVASSGGHLMQLTQLRVAFADVRRHWVTFRRPDAASLLAGEEVTYGFSPTNRNLGNLVRNLVLAVALVLRMRPRAIVSTGAGIAVPFMLVGRLCGARTVYLESLTRIRSPSLTGRLVHPLVDDFFVQWPELEPRFAKARYVGTVFDLS